MPVAIGIVILGALFVYSGLKGIGITDILGGEIGDALNPKGGSQDYTAGAFSGDAATSEGGSALDAVTALLGGGNTPGAEVGGQAPGAKAGSPVSQGTSVGAEHATAGLPGYPAHDYFAPVGSPAVSPVDGKITKLSGNNPSQGATDCGGAFGWSMYIKGANGKSYFLTHLGTRNGNVGDTVKQGQIIGTVADWPDVKVGGKTCGTPAHIHMGVSG